MPRFDREFAAGAVLGKLEDAPGRYVKVRFDQR